MCSVFSPDAKVNVKELLGDNMYVFSFRIKNFCSFTYVEAARALLAIGEMDIALPSLKKAGEKVHEVRECFSSKSLS